MISMADPRTTFRVELATLRDQIAQAIGSHRIAAVEEGLGLYRRMVERVLDQFQAYAAAIGRPGVALTNYYGAEMDWLDEDLRSFIAQAVASGSPDLLRPVYDLLYSILAAVHRRGELNQFGNTLTLYGFLIARVRRADSEFATRVRASVLLQLENFMSFSIVRPTARRDDWQDFAWRMVKAFSEFARTAVDERDVDFLRSVLRHLREATRVVGRRPDDEEESLQRARCEAVLGIAAYSLLRRSRDLLTDVEAVAILRATADAVDRLDLDALSEATHSGHDHFNWHWWETSLWEERGGVLHFDWFMAMAFAYFLVAGAATATTAQVEPDQRVHFVTTEAQRALAALASEDVWAPLRPDVEQFEAARTSLERAQHVVERRQQADLIAAPVRDEKIQAFRDGVANGYTQREGLRSRVAVVQGGEQERPELQFGVNQLVPKEYFTETHVYADPAELGREIGFSIGRGELERLRAELLSFPSQQGKTALLQLRAAVRSAVKDLRNAGLIPAVVVLNAWQAFVELVGPEAYRGSGDDGTFEGAAVLLEHTDGPSACVVADLARSVTLTWWQINPRQPGDEVQMGGRLLTGVQPVSQEVAAEIAASNPDVLRTPDDLMYPDEERLWRLQQRVIVRGFAQYAVTSDQAGGIVLPLDDDAE
jgi:hypothetical protein